MKKLAWPLVLALLGSGCASSGAAAGGGTTAATRPENEGGHHGGHHHHHDLPAPMASLHEVLRPVWHSEAGAGRDGRACEQAATLRARAGAVAEMPVPEGAREREQGWRTATAQLVATAEALVTACGASPRGDVAGALGSFHTAFHGVMDQLGQHP